MNTSDIPQEWINNYVDKMLKIAKKFPSGGLMELAALLRAEHAMDLVQAWREKEDRKTKV